MIIDVVWKPIFLFVIDLYLPSFYDEKLVKRKKNGRKFNFLVKKTGEEEGHACFVYVFIKQTLLAPPACPDFSLPAEDRLLLKESQNINEWESESLRQKNL